MRLANAARAFDTVVCLDGYTSVLLFRAQIGLYDDNKRDSETAQRRVLSIAPGNTLPVRRVVDVGGTRFILGHGNPDYFNGQIIRIGYTSHEAPELARVRSLQQTVLDQPGFTAYAGRAWVKNSAFTEQNSRLTPQHHIHFGSNEVVPDTSIVTFGGRLYVVRASNAGAGGTLVTTCDELPEPSVEVGNIGVGGYDAVTDTVGAGSAAIRVIRLRWQSLFRYQNVASPTFGPEDMQVAIPKTITVVEGARLTLSDGVWYLASVSDESGVWLCRATRHG